MALFTDMFQSEFPVEIRTRGEGYYQGGRVRLVFSDKDLVRAQVRGSRLYDVTVSRLDDSQGEGISCECTCPYFGQHGVCKHVWAVLRLLDEMESDEVHLDIPDNVISFEQVDSRASVPAWRRDLDRIVQYQDYSLSALPQKEEGPEPVERELRFEIPLEGPGWSSRLYVRTMVRQRLKTGKWGKWKKLPEKDDGAGLGEADYLLVTAVQGVNSAAEDSYYIREVGMVEQQALRLLPRLCASGRLFWSEEGAVEGPLSWDDGTPWTCAVKLEPRKEGYALTTFLEREGEQRLLKEAHAIAANCIIWEHGISRFAGSDVAVHWVEAMTGMRDIEIPADDVQAFMDLLKEDVQLPRVHVADGIDFVRRGEVEEKRLRMVTDADSDGTRLRAQVLFRYGEESVAAGSPATLLNDQAGNAFVRDRATEEQAMARLYALGGHAAPRFEVGQADVWFPRNALGHLVNTLTDEGWTVAAQDTPYRAAGAMKVAVRSGIDWFDLKAHCDFDGAQASLPALLKAARKKEQWVELDDGSYGMLPDEWLEKWAPIVALGDVTDEAVRFSSAQAGLLDAWLMEQPDADVDEQFARMRAELHSFTEVGPAKAPRGFRGALRSYQKEGLGWLHFLARFGLGGCLADDMGLGKTVQMLALLEERRTQRKKENRPPSLVVAPRSLVFNWLREAEQFTPRLRFLDHTGSDRGLNEGWEKSTDVVLTTYGTLRRDIGILKEIRFDYVVLDESQAIKNAVALTTKSTRLLKAEHRVAMSGTPVENHLGELWSLMEFLNPGLLGHAKHFSTNWEKGAEPEQRAVLARALRPFILRRTKSQVAKELPERQEDTLYCALAPAQRKQYDELRDHYRERLLAKVDKTGLNRSKMQVLEALLRLRQAACHPGLVDASLQGQPCAKLDALLPRLRELIEEGHKALVFSQFTSFLAILKEQLDEEGIRYEYLDGRTRHRQTVVDRFQHSPERSLFLISLKAGGLGLNLTAADYVFLLDPWWNPATEAQAIDRAHRIGQVNKVLAYRLIARDTVEEKVLALQQQKKELADAILSEDKALIRTLTREDLELLLS